MPSPASHESFFRPEDREFLVRELSEFLPDRIFDAHCHLLEPGCAAPLPNGMARPIGLTEYHAHVDPLHGGRTMGALFLPFPQPRERAALAGQWIGRAVTEDPACRGFYLVSPEDDPEQVRDQVKQYGLHGLKCYHTLSARKPTWEADIPDYLPEALVRVAHEEGWAITLHMVKSRAVADPENRRWIRRYCEQYPGMRLILAHSARGFQPAHNLEGLPELVGLNNLYFDTSANCEAMAHLTILRLFGPDRLMYGSDFWVSHLRGRSLGAADSFLWLYEDTPVWGEKHVQVHPVLVGLEHLRSVKWACWAAGLTRPEVEAVFYDTAAHLFGVGDSKD